ncbi:MAG TPA: ABC transporter permease [Streptosporangiaceae bacterium]|jgi:peptide/nickel transport system permease protein|nr:ABC transporter permease [Streptosporangiaceae bacterium]
MSAAETEPAGPGAVGSGTRPEAERPGQRWSWRLILGAFARNWQAQAGLAVVVLLVLFCFLGPLFYRTNQVTVQLELKDIAPGARYPLGTDDTGFDVLGRLMVAGQSSLELGFAVAITTTVLGTAYGAIAGIAGGVVDAVMMRVVDTLLAIPWLVLLLILVNYLTPNLWTIIALLSILSWLGVARLVRGEVISLRTRDFVLAARTMGSTSTRIMFRHLIPNAMGVIVVSATFSIADAILALSTLSFLGLGLPPPHADWGSMLTGGLNDLFNGYWWLVYPPAVILIVTIIAFSLIGDALRDSLDVRLRRR